MNYFFVIPSVLITVISSSYAIRKRNQNLFLKRKYSPIRDVDRFVREEKEKLENHIKSEREKLANERQLSENLIKEERDQLKTKKSNFNKDINSFKSSIKDLKNEIKEYQSKLQAIQNRINLAKESEETLYLNCEYYIPDYKFKKNEKWKKELNSIKSLQKRSLESRLPYFF